MPANRTARINEEFLRTMTAILPDIKDPRVKDCFVSVLRCEVSSDMKYAKVFISLLGEGDPKALLKGLESSAGFIKREIGQRMRLRAMPELRFVIDDSIEQGAKMSELMRKIREEDEAKQHES